jgi:D-alanyl-D-alanine carboxypeptidase (penicillin-binding protein 5/6)
MRVLSMIAGAAAAVLALGAAGWAATAPSGAGFQSAASNAILIEAESGSVLYEKNADQLVPPASLAKLMTVETVLNQVGLGKVSLETEFTVSEHAWRTGGAPSGTSTMFAAIHSRIKVGDLLRGVIIDSANDGCIVLAEGISGTEAEFARMMNDRARDIGLTKSTFTNSNGLPDPQMKVTPRELALIAQRIIRTYPDQFRWFAERDFLWNKIRQNNRNPLLAMGIGADGMKTGYTKEAGYGIVGTAVQNGMRLIVVVNGSKTDKERADEAKKLLEYGFRSFESRPLFAEGQAVAQAKVYGGEKGSVAVAGKGAIMLMSPKAGGDRIVAKVIYTGPVRAPVEQGQPIGRLQVWRNESLALEVPLQAAESVSRGTTTQRAFDAATELVIELFRAGAKRL